MKLLFLASFLGLPDSGCTDCHNCSAFYQARRLRKYMATTKDSQRQERRQANKLGGSVNSGSGNGWIRKGDVRTDNELWELKITDAKSYSLKDAELQKNINH